VTYISKFIIYLIRALRYDLSKRVVVVAVVVVVVVVLLLLSRLDDFYLWLIISADEVDHLKILAEIDGNSLWRRDFELSLYLRWEVFRRLQYDAL